MCDPVGVAFLASGFGVIWGAVIQWRLDQRAIRYGRKNADDLLASRDRVRNERDAYHIERDAARSALDQISKLADWRSP